MKDQAWTDLEVTSNLHEQVHQNPSTIILTAMPPLSLSVYTSGLIGIPSHQLAEEENKLSQVYRCFYTECSYPSESTAIPRRGDPEGCSAQTTTFGLGALSLSSDPAIQPWPVLSSKPSFPSEDAHCPTEACSRQRASSPRADRVLDGSHTFPNLGLNLHHVLSSFPLPS